MKKNNYFLFLFFMTFLTSQTSAEEWKPSNWPILKHYDSEHLYQIALPIGGIGTGTVSLGGRGELRDWEIMNVPAKKYSTVTTGNNAPFFAVHIDGSNNFKATKLLEGPIYDYEYLHAEGRPVNHHGLPRFEKASFDAAYPFGQVSLSDSNLPIKVVVKGFNPLVPTDEDKSSLPVAVLSYEVTNTSNKDIDVSICGSIRNFIGKDGSNFSFDWKGDRVYRGAKNNKNRFKKTDAIKGIFMYSDSVKCDNPAWGTMALTTLSEDGISYRTSSRNDDWGNSLLDFWDDFSDDGVLLEKYKDVDNDPMASLAVKKHIAAGETKTFTFYLTWVFPNRVAWSNNGVIGNYYSHLYKDAWNAAEKIVPQIPNLEDESLLFVNSFLSSSLPDVVKEAALFNLSTLRSQTVFRIPSGHLMGWEGVMDRNGSCAGTCTHVWNYEVATPFLFGRLAKTMRDVEFNYSTGDNGAMRFRAQLPLRKEKEVGYFAADGQLGCIMKIYREWQLCGDYSYLSSNWNQIKKALSFAWIEKGWDGNQDGVMEGSQHNTMDVNYFGPNPQMGFWYMGALRAAEEMANAMNDKKFAKKCHSLFEKGSTWMDNNLFNGEYYEHKVTDPKTFKYIDIDDPKTDVPDYQLAKGCLVDQLVGQYMAHICGLGYIGDKEHQHKTLESIYKYNFLSDFSNHFNNMRSYAMGKEAGLLMASWPKGRLKVPFPYFSEVMTGFEYCTAVSMIQEGMYDKAINCVKAIRDRHDGLKRNPFSEPECGHHYARAMASWGLVLALSDFGYSAVDKSMNFTKTPGNYFWSNGYAWGMCKISNNEVELKVIHGGLSLKTITLNHKRINAPKNINLAQGENIIVKL